jgi:hypothetical protein
MKLLIFAIFAFTSAFSTPVSTQCGYLPGNTFTAYMCPDKGKAWQSEITKIDPLSGTIVCNYRTADNQLFVQPIHTNCATPGLSAGVKLTNGTIDTAAQSVFNGINKLSPNAADSATAYSTVPLRKEIDKALDLVSGKGNSITQSGILNSLPPIDSHSKKEGTVPAILTGVLTLDGDYFEHSGGKVRFINELGEASINPDYINITKDNTILTGTILNKIRSVFTKEGNLETTKFATFNPMAFMDLQVLGFYVYLSENLISGYMDIVYIIFMMASVGASGLYGYKKFFQKSAGADFKVNKMTYVTTAVAGFLFFTAPVIRDNVETTGAISKAIYTSGITSTAGQYGSSTIAQQTVRYAAQLGTYFANVESDYAMQAFLALIRFKQGFFEDPKTISYSFEKRLKTIEGNLLQASFYSNYISNVCVPYFGENFQNMTSSDAKNSVLTSGGKEQTINLKKTGMGADRLNINTCIVAANNLNDISKNVIVAKKDFLQEAQTYTNMYARSSTDDGDGVIGKSVQKNFKDFMQMMIWTQNTFGWMASITPHASYLFFKNVNAFQYGTGLLHNNVTDKDRKENFANGEKSEAKQDGTTTSAGEYVTGAVESVTGSIIGVVAQNSAWFMVPGFSNIYGFLNERLQSFAFKGGTGNQSEFGGRIDYMLDSMVGLISSTPIGKILLVPFKGFASAMGATDPYVKLQLLITLISFLLALVITCTMISTVTVLIVTVFLAFKIVMYFVELIIFFMSVPIVGIYSALLSEDPQKYMQTFGKNLAMLVISPLMIVTSSYLVLPISELFKGLFSALVTLLFRIFDKGEDELNMDVVGTNILDTLSKVTALASMQGVADIFAMMSTIIISYIVIFNYKEWFTKLIGLDGVTDHTKSAYSDFKSKGEKYISPL